MQTPQVIKYKLLSAELLQLPLPSCLILIELQLLLQQPSDGTTVMY